MNDATTLSQLATTNPAASRVFHAHGLDYCCGGGRTLEDACAAKGLDAAAIAAELDQAEPSADDVRWDLRTVPELVDHILTRYHEPLRPELDRLVAMARKVEAVHGDKASCPRGLAAHLAQAQAAVIEHLEKEEQILFPLILDGQGARAMMPVRVLTAEHDDHGAALRRSRELATDFQPPADACTTWRALYLGLEQLEHDLMDHIHLENNVLFPKVLRGAA